MFTETQMMTMLDLQNKMNTKVDPNWFTADRDWMLATVMEAAEAIEHYGWKWWKHQESDLAQLQMELVDIWHFILSYMLIKNEYTFLNQSNSFSFDGTLYYPESNSLVENLKLMIGLGAVNRYEISLFEQIIKQADLSFDDLFKQYIGKNVLNMFRQDKEYKKGTYNKIWFDGREDNEHLTDIINTLDMNTENVTTNIYSLLLLYYNKNK